MKLKTLIILVLVVAVLTSSGCVQYTTTRDTGKLGEEGGEIIKTPQQTTSEQPEEPQTSEKTEIEKIYDINIYEVFVTLGTYCALHGGASLKQGGDCDEFDTLSLRTSLGNETAEKLLFEKYGQYAEKIPIQKSKCTYENAQYRYGNFTLKRAQCFRIAYKLGIFTDPLDKDENVTQDCRFYSCVTEEKKSCIAIPTARIDGFAESESECDKLCEMYSTEPGEHEGESGRVICICCEYVTVVVD